MSTEDLKSVLQTIRNHALNARNHEMSPATAASIASMCEEALTSSPNESEEEVEQDEDEEEYDENDFEGIVSHSYTPAIDEHDEECPCLRCERDNQHHQIFTLLKAIYSQLGIIASKIS